MYWTDSSQLKLHRAKIPRNSTDIPYVQDLLMTNVQDPAGIAFDWISRYLNHYNITWRRVQKFSICTKIKRLHCSRSSMFSLLKSCGFSCSIVIDFDTCLFYRNIYWTDKQRNVISVAKEDGNYQKTLLYGGNDFQPTSIAVNPPLRWVLRKNIYFKYFNKCLFMHRKF